VSRTLKKILVLFTLLCIVVVLVFAAELVYLNRDGGEADAKAPPAGSPAGTATPPPTSPETESAPPTDTTPPASESSQEEADSSPEHPPEESQYTLAMTPEVSLTLNADAEEFVYEIKDEGYTFTYKESAATLDVLLDYLPRGAASRAVGFLDNYPGVGESTVENEREIGKSSLVGAYVTAMSGESTYAAWIYEIPSEDDHLGILFVIHYADEAQRGALYKLLDSIELIPTTLDLNADGEIDGLRMPGEPG
jgi:hypothetical protein